MKKSCRSGLKLKILVFFAVFACSSARLSALDFSFNFEPFWSIQYGSVQEYVWSSTGSTYDYKLSELLWDISPLWAGGLRASAVLEGFELYGSFAFGIPAKSGSMQDSDWLNDIQSQKTHYSKSDNSVSSYMYAEGRFAYTFKLPKNWTVSPFLAFVYRGIGFNSEGGTFDYPLGSPPYTEVGSGINRKYGTFTGKVISYEQYAQYFSLGTRASWILKEKWKFGGTLSFIPFIFATGYDNHWLTSTDYVDVMYGGFGLSGELNASFILGKGVLFTAGFNVEYLSNLKGPSYESKSGSGGSSFEQLRAARKNPIYALYLSNQGFNGSFDFSGVYGGGGLFVLGGYLSVTISF